MDEAVNEATSAMHNVSPAPVSSVVFARLEVNGVPTDALVDTGSPATIVLLGFILQVLAGGRDSKQTPAEWKMEMMKRFSASAVALTNYGGNRLNIVAHIPVTRSQGHQQNSRSEGCPA